MRWGLFSNFMCQQETKNKECEASCDGVDGGLRGGAEVGDV